MWGIFKKKLKGQEEYPEFTIRFILPQPMGHFGNIGVGKFFGRGGEPGFSRRFYTSALHLIKKISFCWVVPLRHLNYTLQYKAEFDLIHFFY